ncbi:MAG: ABC transporter permease [Dehalococcoidia bacterium]|nr:ABC transporter permease [Dehalococcoidia bacterium]
MKGLAALLKKELKEQVRTNRIIIVAGVFLFFGLATPLMYRYLPELLALAGDDMGSILPPPTAMGAMAEYASTMVQFGVLVIVLVAMGAISRERESGTAALVLSKPAGYTAFVVAKFKAIGATTLIGTILGGLACWGYTYILFEEAPVWGFFCQNALLLLYLLLTIAMTLLFSSLFRRQLTAGALGLVSIIVLSIASGLPWFGKYLPGELVSWGNYLLVDEPTSAAWGAVAVTLVFIILSLYLAGTILQKKEI